MATPWDEILKTLILALKRQVILNCPCRTLLNVNFKPNALHWAELNQAFSLNIKFQPLIRINKIYVYNPLVYFIVFGEVVLKQLLSNYFLSKRFLSK